MGTVVDVCATGMNCDEMYESYLESVLLTQSDQSQHLKQNKRVDTDASSHSTALYEGPTLCCAAEVLSLLGCACSAAPASHSMLTTVLCQPKPWQTFMLTGLLSPWTILCVQRYDISRNFIHRKCSTVLRNICSTRVARMGLLLFYQGIKFHCLRYLLYEQT